MKRYIRVPLLASLALLTLGAAPARAQSEVTPFVSLGSVNSSRAGAAIRFAWTSDLSLEAEVGYRRDAIDALSTSLSLSTMGRESAASCHTSPAALASSSLHLPSGNPAERSRRIPASPSPSTPVAAYECR